VGLPIFAVIPENISGDVFPIINSLILTTYGNSFLRYFSTNSISQFILIQTKIIIIFYKTKGIYRE
jgi:hypothetical protein